MSTKKNKTINFLSIPIHQITMQETIDQIDNCIRTNEHINYTDINAGKIVAMQTDKELYNSIISCDLINADGQSIIWAARFLGEKLPERITGIDLMTNLVELAYKRNYKCFFLGAKETVVREVVEIYTKQYGPDIIAGYRNGYFNKEEEVEIAEQIAGSGANLLFVAITSPKKDIFLNEHQSILNKVNFTMGVGGSFDVIAGVTKRAPLRMQKMGLEWFFRLIQEPRRMWKRYLFGNILFIKIVLKERFKKKK